MFIFFAQLAISAFFFVVGELLRPKPDYDDAESIPFEESRLPQTDPEKKQPVIWGKVLITGPHVMDVVQYVPIAVKKKVKTGLFSSTKVVVAHRYFWGIQLGLPKGPCVLRKIFYDDTLVWSGTSDSTADTTGFIIDINLPDFLGGREEGGGIVGRFRFFSGSPTQQTSEYLAQFRTLCPAYRWTSYINLEFVEVGETADISPFTFELERYPDPLGLGSTINRIGDDLNPMSLVAECFTDSDWGFNRGAELQGANLIAVATTLKAEGNGISLKWINNQTIDRLLETVNKQVDGIFRFNPWVGLWQYKLMRPDYVFDDLPIFSPDTNIKQLSSFSRANWSETVNEVEVAYSNRDSLDNPSPAIARDQSNYKRQGRHKTLKLSFPGIYNPEIAQAVASRELRTNGFPFASCSMITDRSGYVVLPGDAFRLQYEVRLKIVDIVMRVGAMGFGDLDQSEIQINAIEDVFMISPNIFAPPPLTAYTTVNGPPTAITVQKFMDQDFFFAMNDADRSSYTTEKPLVVAAKPQTNALSYEIEARIGTDPFVLENTSQYTLHGTVQSAFVESDGNGILLTTLVVENVDLPFLLTDIADESEIKLNGKNLLIVVSSQTNPNTGVVYEPELMAYETVTSVGSTVTLHTVHRALSDTQPAAYAVGDHVWFLTGEELGGPSTTDTEYNPTALVDMRLINVATSGRAAAGATMSFTFRNRVNRPWLPRNVKINDIYYPVVDFDWGTDITISWLHNNKTYHDGATQGQLFFQDDTLPSSIEPGFEYLLEIYDDVTDTLLRRVRPVGSLNTPAAQDTLSSAQSYTYTIDKQIDDGTPFAAATYRFELSVEQSVSGVAPVNSLLEVYRTCSIVTVTEFPPNYGDPAYIQFIYPLSHYELINAGLSDPGTSDYLAAFAIGPGVLVGSTYTRDPSYYGFRHTSNDGGATAQVELGYHTLFCQFGTLSDTTSDAFNLAGCTTIGLKDPCSLTSFLGAYPTEENPWIAVLNGEKFLVTNIAIISAIPANYILTVQRGVLGTVPKLDHVDGDTVYIMNNLAIDTTARAVGLTIEQYVLPFDNLGPTTEDHTTAISHVVQSDQYKPYPPHNFRSNGHDIFEAYHSVVDSVQLTWNHWNRVNVLAIIPYEDQTDDGPEAGISYDITLYDVTGGGSTLLTTINTGANSTTFDVSAAPISNTPGAYKAAIKSVRSGVYSDELSSNFIIGLSPEVRLVGRDHVNGKLFGVKSGSSNAFEVFKENATNSGVIGQVTPTPLVGVFYAHSTTGVRPQHFYVGGKWYGFVSPTTSGTVSWGIYLGRSVGSDPTDIEAYWLARSGVTDGIASYNLFYTNGYFWLMGFRQESAGDSAGPLYIYRSTDMQTWVLMNTLVTTTYKFVPKYFEWDPVNSRYVMAGDVADEWYPFYGLGTPLVKILYTTDFVNYTTAATITDAVTGIRMSVVGSDGAGRVLAPCEAAGVGYASQVVLCSSDYLSTWTDRITEMDATTVSGSSPVGYSFVSHGRLVSIFRSTALAYYGVYALSSGDNGATWTEVLLVDDSIPGSLPLLMDAFRDADDNIFVSVVGTGVYGYGAYTTAYMYYKSSDGGLTWSAINDYT